MEKKQRFFIYDRREAGVLVLLGVMVAVFAFTLGVHLGKKVGFKGGGHPEAGSSPVAAAPEVAALPSNGPDVPQGLDENLKQSLHDEVARTGIKLDQPRQVDLPARTRAENGGATTPESDREANAAAEGGPDGHSAVAAPSPGRSARSIPPIASERVSRRRRAGPSSKSRFALQVGSFADLNEAKQRAGALKSLGMKASIHSAEVKGKGTWYRIYLGGFATRDDAARAGERYRARRVIDSYIVAKAVD